MDSTYKTDKERKLQSDDQNIYTSRTKTSILQESYRNTIQTH